jgi:hypothetical protein
MWQVAILLVAIACGFIACNQEPECTVMHRGRDGRPDHWVYRIEKHTYTDKELVKIEGNRNFDGQVDLVKVYSHGLLVREIHDDDFDGKPQKIENFRHGKLAIVELDPQERSYIDIVEYYNDSGKLIRREFQQK